MANDPLKAGLNCPMTVRELLYMLEAVEANGEICQFRNRSSLSQVIVVLVDPSYTTRFRGNF